MVFNENQGKVLSKGLRLSRYGAVVILKYLNMNNIGLEILFYPLMIVFA